MAVELSVAGVEQLLKGITIPPRPIVLIEVDQELKRPEPDLKKVAGLIARDVGVSAAMLKTVNSPLFGLRSKVGSVLQAVQLLGARNTRNVVTSLVLRSTMGGAAASLERFWDSSEKVASISAYICTMLPKAPREEAYTFGIFHDCGIPALMQRFGDYRDTLKIAGGDSRPPTEVEEERHGTNHATIGYLIAHSWGLSDVICQAIQRHHDLGALGDDDSFSPMARVLVAVNFLAEHLHETSLRMRDDRQWVQGEGIVLDYLGLTHGEYAELSEDVMALCT
ncbi:MAG: HDOD domain-containing protein [Betaproteobacteria bacterium]|nr:HDOD domain-containing protein [Rhodocyclales bacterium]